MPGGPEQPGGKNTDPDLREQVDDIIDIGEEEENDDRKKELRAEKRRFKGVEGADWSPSEKKLLRADENKDYFDSHAEKKLIGLKYENLEQEDVDAMKTIKETLGEEFFDSTVLYPGNAVPKRELRELAETLHEISEQEQKELDITRSELAELQEILRAVSHETIDTSVVEEGEGETAVEKFIRGQRDEYFSAEEVFGEDVTQKEKTAYKVMERLSTMKLSDEEKHLNEIRNDHPEIINNMLLSGVSVHGERMTELLEERKEETGEELHQEDYYELRDEAANELRNKFQRIAEWQQEVHQTYGNEFFERSSVFQSPIAYKEKVFGDLFDENKVTVEEITPGEDTFDEEKLHEFTGYIEGENWQEEREKQLQNTEEELPEKIGKSLRKQVAIREELDPKGDIEKTAEEVGGLLTQLAEGAENVSDVRSDRVEENFEAFERIISAFGLKSWIEENAGEWYHNARQEYLEEKGSLSASEKKLLDNLVGDETDKGNRQVEDTSRQKLTSEVEHKKWYKNIGSQKTKTAINQFNVDQFIDTLTSDKQNELIQADVGENDRFASIDVQNHLMVPLLDKVHEGDADTVKSRKEYYAANPDDPQLEEDVQIYLSDNLQTIMQQHNSELEIEHPRDIARLTFIALIKDNDRYALEYHAKDYESVDSQSVDTDEHEQQDAEKNNEENENQNKQEETDTQETSTSTDEDVEKENQ